MLGTTSNDWTNSVLSNSIEKAAQAIKPLRATIRLSRTSSPLLPKKEKVGLATLHPPYYYY
jgi:hypothetical protein